MTKRMKKFKVLSFRDHTMPTGGTMYKLTKEESERTKIVKFIVIILVVYFYSNTTGVNFSDGANMLYLPGWLQV